MLPGVAGLAGAAHQLGFDGIAMDGELYQEVGNVKTATWAWNYPGNTHSEEQTREEATLRGQQLMAAILQAFPNVEIADDAARFPDTWDGYVIDQSDNVEDAYQANLDINFWDGMTSVDGYAGIWFYDETFNKDTGLTSGNAQTWNSALTYEYNSLFSLFSQDFTNWSYAADHVFLSPSSWIDGDVANEGQWAAPRSPAYVATSFKRSAIGEWGVSSPTMPMPRRATSTTALTSVPYRPLRCPEQLTAPRPAVNSEPDDDRKYRLPQRYEQRQLRNQRRALHEPVRSVRRGHGELADRRWELLDRLCQPHELECAQHRAAPRGEHDHNHR